MIRSWHLSALVVVAVAACGSSTDTTPTQLNLDRPTDIAFACYGGLRITQGLPPTAVQNVTVSAQPIIGCDTRATPRVASDPVVVPPGQEQIPGGDNVPVADYYALILQSVRGTVGIAQWEPKPSANMQGGEVTVLDADPLTPGKNSISVGEDPVAIATDSSGCKAVTANAGSCDLSVLDITSALVINPSPIVDRLIVTNASGQPIRSRPSAMVAQPNITAVGLGYGPQQTDACPATATGIMYIAYPSCHAVAAVDVSTGMVKRSVTFDAAGVVTLQPDGNLICPDECAGGATITTGPRPVALDLEVDPRSMRQALAIGSENLGVVSLVELDANFLPASSTSYPLQDPTGTLGVTSLAISPQIGMGGANAVINDGTGPGGQSQFIYAVTTDHTVRVIDILNINAECDTQVDPRLIHDIRNIKTMSCFKVGDPATPARRPGAHGPGIAMVGDGVPTSVAIVRADPLDGDSRPTPFPTKLIGYFAIVTASNGSTFVVNIDDDAFPDLADNVYPLEAPVPMAIAHQLRDGIPSRNAVATVSGTPLVAPNGPPSPVICDTLGPDPDATSGNTGGPRITAPPARNVPSGLFAAEKLASLPYLKTLTCTGSDTTEPVSELAFNAPPAVRDLAFPDLRGIRSDETWTMSWEGSISGDTTNTAVNGPGVRESMLAVDSGGMHLVDQTRPYCEAGVEPYDIVQMRGCDPANNSVDCPIGYTCFTHPDSQVPGLGACMLTDEADRLADACKDFLTSLRRYTVLKTTSGSIQLVPRKRVLTTTPIDGCHDDAQCKTLADYAVRITSPLNPKDDTTAPDKHTWTCAVDADREPKIGYDAAPLRSCIETCTTSADCQTGTVCERGVCMEGVEPPQACVNAPQRYELRVHDAFVVVGTRSGYHHPIIADANGNCVADPAASPFEIGRIPLTAPACDPATDPRTGKKLDGTYDKNPCQYQTMQADNIPQFVANTCTPASPATMLVERPTTGILFRNPAMTMTLVDPTYPGDLACNGDRGGSFVNVPTVFTGVQLAFRLTAGLAPLTVPVAPSYPIKVLRGPGQSVWIVDEGDYLSTSITLPSTRGKVFRVEAAALNVVNLLE